MHPRQAASDGDGLIDLQGDDKRWSDYMAAAHRGDQRLYERLLHELGSVIEAYIRSRFGMLAFTEDCVQECLIAIHKARHTYDPARPFRPWLFAVVRNRTVDLLRRSYTGERALQAPTATDMTAPDPRAEIEAGDILASLKPEFRNALALTKLIGYSINEAAARSGISEAAMKSRVRRAVKAAESMLEADRGHE